MNAFGDKTSRLTGKQSVNLALVIDWQANFLPLVRSLRQVNFAGGYDVGRLFQPNVKFDRVLHRTIK